MNGSNNLGNILKTYAENQIRQDLELVRSIDTSKTVVSQKTSVKCALKSETTTGSRCGTSCPWPAAESSPPSLSFVQFPS